MIAGPGDFHPIIFRIRRKLCWLYSESFIFRLARLRGRLTHRFFDKLYPNFFAGDDARIWGRFYVMMYTPFESEIRIGRNAHIVSDRRRAGITLFSPCKFTTLAGGRIIIGDDVQLNGVAITSRKSVTIGNGVLIAPNCIIVDSDFHIAWPPEKRGHSDASATDKEVVIADNVWLGLNVTVLKGASIGENSIIGAGSVVSGEIPPNVVAAGVPAQVIRKLGETNE
jgi:acetyltransferase-like isoleucine patch superfamily enzyme